jgi:hypothetical protein
MYLRVNSLYIWNHDWKTIQNISLILSQGMVFDILFTDKWAEIMEHITKQNPVFFFSIWY